MCDLSAFNIFYFYYNSRVSFLNYIKLLSELGNGYGRCRLEMVK